MVLGSRLFLPHSVTGRGSHAGVWQVVSQDQGIQSPISDLLEQD